MSHYTSQKNQKEESCTYHNICLALSKRIRRQQEMLENGEVANTEDQKNDTADYAEGLRRMLSSIYAHTSSNVLSATMARKMLSSGGRFRFSHEFLHIPLKHLLEWHDNIEHLEFILRKVKNIDGKWEHVQDFL